MKAFILALSITSLITPGFFSVAPKVETDPSPYPGDSVDDIALWQHPTDPSRSLIVATLKASNQTPRKATGLLVYDLDGTERQFFGEGTPNNVDVRYGFSHEGKSIALFAVSHWWSNDVSLYTIDPRTRLLTELTDSPIPTGLDKLQGLCMFNNPQDGNFYYFVTNRLGEVEQYRIDSGKKLSATRVRSFSLDTGAEGCVVDDEAGRLYIAEESRGIWQFNAMPDDEPGLLIDAVSWTGPLKSDVEGLTLVDDDSGAGWLIASSQGNDLFVVYNRKTNDYVGSFSIVEDREIDAVTGTDGIEAIAADLGPAFPGGVFITQDHENLDDGELSHQNFKLVDWREIAEHLRRLKDQ